MADNNTQTQLQINTLRTLQESYDALAAASSTGATATALETAKQAILDAINTIDIDTSDLAKLGTNPNATNTAILAAVNERPTEDYMKNMYSARFEQNQDGQDTYTVVMPIVAGIEESESGNSVIVTM